MCQESALLSREEALMNGDDAFIFGGDGMILAAKPSGRIMLLRLRPGRPSDQQGATPMAQATADAKGTRRDAYNIRDLAELTGLTERTVQLYSARGILGNVPFRGPATVYGREQLLRLRAAKRLSPRRLGMKEVRRRLDGASPERLAELAGEPPPPPPPDTSRYDPKAARPRELWEHVHLCPGVALLVRQDADTEASR